MTQSLVLFISFASLLIETFPAHLFITIRRLEEVEEAMMKQLLVLLSCPNDWDYNSKTWHQSHILGCLDLLLKTVDTCFNVLPLCRGIQIS